MTSGARSFDVRDDPTTGSCHVKYPPALKAGQVPRSFLAVILFVAATDCSSDLRSSKDLVEAIELAAPSMTSPPIFASVVGCRQSTGTSWIVADRDAQLVARVWSDSENVDTLNHAGAGPTDLGTPRVLLPYRGDSMLVAERGTGKIVVLAPNGVPSRGVTLPPDLVTASIRGGDTAGRMYFDLMRTRQNSASGEVVSVRVLLRWHDGSPGADTIAVLAAPEMRAKTSVQRTGTSVQSGTVIMPNPFASQDGWSVAADGSIGIARVSPYHVEWIGEGRGSIVGPVVDIHDSIPITAKDMERFKIPPALRPTMDWGRYKPPFAWSGIVVVSGEDQLWVPRTLQSDQAERPYYDVFSREGVRKYQVRLPSNARLVGSNSTSLCVAIQHESGEEEVSLYANPVRSP